MFILTISSVVLIILIYLLGLIISIVISIPLSLGLYAGGSISELYRSNLSAFPLVSSKQPIPYLLRNTAALILVFFITYYLKNDLLTATAFFSLLLLLLIYIPFFFGVVSFLLLALSTLYSKLLVANKKAGTVNRPSQASLNKDEFNDTFKGSILIVACLLYSGAALYVFDLAGNPLPQKMLSLINRIL